MSYGIKRFFSSDIRIIFDFDKIDMSDREIIVS